MKKISTFMIIAATAMACNQKPEVPATEAPPAPAPEKPEAYIPSNGKYCFLQVIKKDSMMLSAEIKGDSIKGTFNWVPAEKDRKLSTFKGRILGNTAHTISNVMAEGTVNKEELIFTLQDSTVTVKFGEMLQGDNGVWMYKNKNTVTDEILKKIECKE